MRHRPPWAVGGLLALAVLVCYGGAGFLRLGFYHDDWPLLGYLLQHGGGFLASVAGQLAGTTHLYRPLSPVIWAAAYHLFGFTAPGWHAAAMLLTWGGGLTLWSILRAHRAPPAAAFLAAVAFIAFPNKDATLYWPVTSLQNSTSLLLFLLSYRSHAAHLETGSRAALAAVPVFLLGAMAAYDQAFFMLPVWLLAPGALAPASRSRLKASLALAGGALVLYSLYRFVLVPHFIAPPRSVQFSVKHALFVYYMALRAVLDPRWILYLLRCAGQALVWHPLLSLAALSLPPLALRLLRGGTEPERAPASSLLLWGGAVYLLGYLPFCLSAYAPTAYDQMNRTNHLSAVGAAALLCGLSMLPALRRAGTAALCALAAFFLTVHVAFSEIWVESYRRQLAVRDAVLAHLPDWPVEKTLLVRLSDLYVARKAPVFLTDYDVTYAVRVWTGDWERKAIALSHWVRFEPDGAKTQERAMPYGSVLLLDMTDGGFKTLDYRQARMLPPSLEPWEYPLRFW
ncbi:MAG: hypothetical protein HY928_17665 [Elusimicrobia bacterium]|nr:hypothetical protein [Elusimicrobiota bacterium]